MRQSISQNASQEGRHSRFGVQVQQEEEVVEGQGQGQGALANAKLALQPGRDGSRLCNSESDGQDGLGAALEWQGRQTGRDDSGMAERFTVVG